MKQYAYYIEGNKIALVERDLTFINNVDSKEFGPDVAKQEWKSPTSTEANSIKLKYTYVPKYSLITDDFKIGSSYISDSGFLKIIGTGFPTSGITHILLRAGESNASGILNGLHRVKGFSGDGTYLVTYTKYDNDVSTSEGFSIYIDVSVLEDETFNINLPSYLSKALVYYVKAKFAEDNKEVKEKEYFMREFKKMVEKHSTSRIKGVRIVSSGYNAIK